MRPSPCKHQLSPSRRRSPPISCPRCWSGRPERRYRAASPPGSRPRRTPHMALASTTAPARARAPSVAQVGEAEVEASATPPPRSRGPVAPSPRARQDRSPRSPRARRGERRARGEGAEARDRAAGPRRWPARALPEERDRRQPAPNAEATAPLTPQRHLTRATRGPAREVLAAPTRRAANGRPQPGLQGGLAGRRAREDLVAPRPARAA